MLTEYALTPHLFDDRHNAADPEWLDRLRSFGGRLLPIAPHRVSNTIISDLCDGSWWANAVLPVVDDLERRQRLNPASRIPALDLLKELRPRIERVCVSRPFCTDRLPETEEEWAREAFASSQNSQLPIHRIVGSSLLTHGPNWHRLHELRDEPFWDCIPVTQTPAAVLERQLEAIRHPVQLYSFLAFASPYLDAMGAGKDLAFAVEFIRHALNRPAGFGPVRRIDLHTEGPFRQHERQPFAQRILDRIARDIGAAACVVRLFLWPDILERRLLAGHSNGDKRPGVIWAFSLTHVARPDTDGPEQEPPTFSVLSPGDASRLVARYYGTTGPRPYPGSPWRTAG